MTSAVDHRGPDGESFWAEEGAAFGHRRLSILDPTDRATQPMQTPDGTGVLTYNGEIYNFPELRDELERAGIRFRSSGDTEVVLQALHHWGPEAAIPKFNGMFAFGYFDRRNHTLWLARDRLGIKPMSILRQRDRLLFASEDKAFLAVSGADARLDSRALALRFTRLNEANGTSLLHDVERLAPGSILKMKDRRSEEIYYWDPLAILDTGRIMSNRHSLRQNRKRLEELLVDSVRMHLRADTPIAACLSGGVDSGMLTAFSARELGSIEAFVADPEEGPNESEAAALTAGHVGARLNCVKMTSNYLLDLWPRTIFALESCGYSESNPALLALNEACRAGGIPVLLTGEGADELFGGYSRYRSSMKMWRSLDPPRAWLLREKSRLRMLERFAEAPFSDSIVLGKSQLPLPSLAATAPESGLLPSACVRAVSGLAGYGNRAFLAARLNDLYGHLRELLHRHDRLGMAASVEVRVPFLENELIDFALHLPISHLIDSRATKLVLKKLAEGYLPRANIYKPKLGFPFGNDYTRGTEALLDDGRIQDLMRWKKRTLVDVKKKAADDGHFRMQMVGAEIFARLFAGGETPASITERLKAAAYCTSDDK